jgi:hypothetical protein
MYHLATLVQTKAFGSALIFRVKKRVEIFSIGLFVFFSFWAGLPDGMFSNPKSRLGKY